MHTCTAELLAFFQSLDICFDGDFAHTETVDLEVVADALLGKPLEVGTGSNLNNLSKASANLRKALVMAVNEEVRRGSGGISLL